MRMLSTPWMSPLVAGWTWLAGVGTRRPKITYDIYCNHFGVVVDLDTAKLEMSRKTLRLVAE